MTGDIDNIDGPARTTVIRYNEQRAIKRRKLDQMKLDSITHLEALNAEHLELSLTIEHEVIVNGAVTQLRFRMGLIEVVCRY